MSLRDLTLVLPYYMNGGMLAEHHRIWGSYPRDLRKHFHVIVVDDGSPKDAASQYIQKVPIASYRLYRILPDIRWNWLACRNLGVNQTKTHWVLLTDIDHGLPAETLRNLLTEELNPQMVYRFSRVDAPNLTPYKDHPNSWLLTTMMYDRIGGYDERFSGFYGTDADFRERVQATARAVVRRSDALIRYPREVIPDASTTTYLRKQQIDKDNVQRIRSARALIPDWKPLRLTFPWEQLV